MSSSRGRRLACAGAVAGAVAACAIGLVPAASSAGVGTPPNFVVILVDDQATNTFNRDFMPQTYRWIVDRGTNFTNGLAAPPLCCPDRAGILTGQYPHNDGVFSNDPGYPSLNDPGDTLPVWLHRAGYRTGFIGKFLNNTVATLGRAKAPGFDRWFAYDNGNEYFDYTMADQEGEKAFGSQPASYTTNVFTRQALAFTAAASREAVLPLARLQRAARRPQGPGALQTP